MTFDLPGLPYIEPCFANSARRDPDNDVPQDVGDSEKQPLLSGSSGRQGYRKDRWHKGLIGVVYEVTAADFAHIIATEGGGAACKDILVDCYPFPSDDSWDAVPQIPTTKPFKAHTLFAPAVPEGETRAMGGHSYRRPNPGYAQASARYLKLLTDGAEECGLPLEYQEYLLSLHPFTMTTTKQRLGKALIVSTCVPPVLLLFAKQILCG